MQVFKDLTKYYKTLSAHELGGGQAVKNTFTGGYGKLNMAQIAESSFIVDLTLSKPT